MMNEEYKEWGRPKSVVLSYNGLGINAKKFLYQAVWGSGMKY